MLNWRLKITSAGTLASKGLEMSLLQGHHVALVAFADHIELEFDFVHFHRRGDLKVSQHVAEHCFHVVHRVLDADTVPGAIREGHVGQWMLLLCFFWGEPFRFEVIGVFAPQLLVSVDVFDRDHDAGFGRQQVVTFEWKIIINKVVMLTLIPTNLHLLLCVFPAPWNNSPEPQTLLDHHLHVRQLVQVVFGDFFVARVEDQLKFFVKLFLNLGMESNQQRRRWNSDAECVEALKRSALNSTVLNIQCGMEVNETVVPVSCTTN